MKSVGYLVAASLGSPFASRRNIEPSGTGWRLDRAVLPAFNAALAQFLGLGSHGIGTLLSWRSSGHAARPRDAEASGASGARRALDVRLIALALGLAAATLFGLTAHWDAGGRVNPGDSAKFQYLPIVNGTPHATGYPTYLMIGKLLYWALPFVPASARTTAISVACGACATAVIFLWCMACTNAVVASLAAAALVATGANFWLAATDAEVYALHLLYYSSVLLFLTRALNGSGKASLRAALIVYALSFGNHLTMIALAPAVAWVVWVLEGQRLWRPRTLIVGAGLVLLAVGQYAYIYYLSHWGDGRELEYVRNDVSLGRLARYMTGQQFRRRMFVYSPEHILTKRMPEALGVIFEQLSLPGVACAALGVFRALVRPLSARFLRVLALALGSQLFIALNYRVESGLYLTPIAVLLSPFIALGLSYLPRWWMVAPVALGVIAFHARESFESSSLRVVSNYAAQVRWQSAQAVGCRALIAGPDNYNYNLIRKYLRYTGEYSQATPFASIKELDSEDGLCVDTVSKQKLELLGYGFRPNGDSLWAFLARNAEHTLLVALASDGELDVETRRAFESIGSKASALRAGGAYVAVVHHGRTIAEQLSDGRAVQLSLEGGSKVGGFVPRRSMVLRAAGPRFGGKRWVRFANAERRIDRRGARLVVLDSKQMIIGDATVPAATLNQFHLYFALDKAPERTAGKPFVRPAPKAKRPR